MRVIAGHCKGRQLRSPPGERTRPILDRVKASLFDWLGARLALPGRLPAVHVCDLYCGAGSQGIEALSRGAASCSFVETDSSALKCLRENLERCGLVDRAVIVGRPAERLSLHARDGGGFGIIFLDPPYRESEAFAPKSAIWGVVSRLGREIAAEPGALLLWRHSDRFEPPGELPAAWLLVDRRSWGSMGVSMYQRPTEGSP